MSHVQPPPVPLPDVPGKVHGIVSLDPPMVQCDGCLKTHTERTLSLTILLSHILFNPRQYHHGDQRRLCRECAREAGWDS